MKLLLAIFISLLPFSAFAELPTPPPTHAQSQMWNVIPDGYGNVTYWRGQGGTDAYTAGIIGQGLSHMTTPAPRSTYTPPPLTAPDFQYNHQADPVGEANQTFLEYLYRR